MYQVSHTSCLVVYTIGSTHPIVLLSPSHILPVEVYNGEHVLTEVNRGNDEQVIFFSPSVWFVSCFTLSCTCRPVGR